jgi:YidC/Oxa1 family membrane protein insertase
LDTRLLVAVVLSLAAVFAYQELVLKRLYPPKQESIQQHQVQASPKGAQATYVPPALPVTSNLPSNPLPVPVQEQNAPARIIQVQNEDFIAKFTTHGGRLLSLKLKNYHETAVPNSPLLELVTASPNKHLPLGLVVDTRQGRLNDRNLTYHTDAPSNITLNHLEHASITFTGAVGGLDITKTVQFSGTGYVFHVNAAVKGPPNDVEALGLSMSEPLNPHAGYYDIPQVQTLVNQKATVDAEKALHKGVQPLKGDITYAGFGDRYFLTVFLPTSPRDGTVAMSYSDSEATAEALFSPKPVDGVMTVSTQVYTGPKSITALEEVNPELRRAIDFGWSGILALAFLRALKLFHYVAPNWGVDIILLTVAFRVAFLPMSIKSQRSMMRLQRLQPQVEKLREKFKDDKERLNREMVDLYKRNHVNPLGGCLPMLLQLPIFIGLYEALLNAVELRHAPFFGWIRDLSAPECLPIPGFPKIAFLPCGGIPVLVLLMGISTYFQQKMTPQSPDPSQQRMMMLMPLVFTVMFLNFPAGLTLYYFCSNALGIAQQYVLNREFKQLSPANA